jgi:hypothetical protein
MTVLRNAALMGLKELVHTESTGKRSGFIRLELKGVDMCGHAT